MMQPHAFPIHQALAVRYGDAEVRWLGQSPEFNDGMKPLLEEIAVKFGVWPAGRRCPEAAFVLPNRAPKVVLGRVAELGEAPAALGFHFLVLDLNDFDSAGAEAFQLIQAAPPVWHLRGALPGLCGSSLTALRSVKDLEPILKTEQGPLLLGAAQALIDGSRLAFHRAEPANDLIEGLWSLLPYRNRLALSAATFAFGNALEWHILATPEIKKEEFDHRWLSEEQALNYPEGRFELSLQIAVENGDDGALRKLLLRRTRMDTLKMGLWLVGGMAIASVAFAVLKLIRP